MSSRDQTKRRYGISRTNRLRELSHCGSRVALLRDPACGLLVRDSMGDTGKLCIGKRHRDAFAAVARICKVLATSATS
jgi:hypothetical protein